MAKIVSGAFEGRNLEVQRKNKVYLRWSENFQTKWEEVTSKVAGYYVADSAHRVAMGAGAAAAGAILLGPIGLAGGLLAAKKKRLSVVTWRDGTQSVLEIKDKKLHESLVLAVASNGFTDEG